MKLYKENIFFTYTFISIVAIIVLPAYVILFLPPQFTGLIVDNTKNEAVRVTSHFISMFIQEETDLKNSRAVAALKKNDEKIREEFHLVKIKLFLPDGEVVFSSDPKDIGKFNDHDYFFDIVAKGNVYPKLVEKNTSTLEGQILKVDVVETYVPVMKDGVFVGAFEIYFDVTSILHRLDRLMTQIYGALFVISGCLLFVIIFSSIRVKRTLEERQKYERKLHDLSVTDQLTGLLNRRGFMNISEKQIEIVNRAEDVLFLFYADIDNMKDINDSFGHDVGDLSLKETATLLRSTFRRSDIISRLGGDEFAVLLTDSPAQDSEKEIVKRFFVNLEKINRQPDRKYTLKISFGIAKYSADNPCDLEELMSRADRLMYERKMKKKSSHSRA